MSEKEESILSINRLECEKCGAVWINGQHYWRTGCVGNEVDLASLVCQPYGDDRCINSQKTVEGGDTWQQRLKDIDRLIQQQTEP
jgi:hypothetical protein